jgi:hypothetical protein
MSEKSGGGGGGRQTARNDDIIFLVDWHIIACFEKLM